MDLGLQQELKLKRIERGRLGILIGLLCPALYASEIDLKLTTSDGSSQVSVVNGAASTVAEIDSSGNINFKAALIPNGQPGQAGQILQSNGPAAPPVWVSSVPIPATLLSSTNPWTAQQTYENQVTVSSDLVVNNGVITGNGSGLINLKPESLSAGSLPGNVVASSMAVGAYGAITGVGVQSQALNMGNKPINSVGTPAADNDAATKAYVDTATGTANASMKTYVDTTTGTLNTALQGYVTTATGTLNTSMKAYVDAATATAITVHLMSTNTWTGQQTYTKQISVSTSMVLSGAFIAGGSAGSSGNLLQSQGSGSSPLWISSITLLGGAPILKQGPASLSFAVKSATCTMTTADFAILGDANAVGFTITLPSAANAGMVVFIVKKDISGNNVRIAAAGGETIAGGSPINMYTPYQKTMLIADGVTTWYIMNQ
jgi:hypothetical protein